MMIAFSKLVAFFYTHAFLSAFFYVIVCISHHISSILYVKMCTPATLWGILTSPFMVMTPQCSALSWIVHNSRGHIMKMWIIFGNFGISFFTSAVLYSTNRSSSEREIAVQH